MTEEKPSITGDPSNPQAYLKEFVEGEISYNPDTLAQAYLTLADQATGVEQTAYQALAWAIGASRIERRLGAKIRQLEERIRALETGRGA